LTLEQAQRRKHDYIAEQIGIGEGRRLLDLGCGWGGLLNYRAERGSNGVGVALSRLRLPHAVATASTCTCAMRARSPAERFGQFDALASLGAFEHFCSPKDYRAGRQEAVYRQFFANTASLLPVGGRFYLQTMVFRAEDDPDRGRSQRHAPRDSDAFILFLLGCQFPASFFLGAV